MITTLTKGLKGLLAAGLGALMLTLAPHAVADTNDNAYVNVMDENNIHSVGAPADLIYASRLKGCAWWISTTARTRTATGGHGRRDF